MMKRYEITSYVTSVQSMARKWTVTDTTWMFARHTTGWYPCTHRQTNNMPPRQPKQHGSSWDVWIYMWLAILTLEPALEFAYYSKPVSEVTYTVSSGTLNSTIPYHAYYF